MDKELKEILLNHEQRLENLEQISKENREQLKILNQRTEKHEKTLDEHTQMLQDLHRSMLVIEDAVTKKKPALFDGNKMHQEMQERLEKRVDKIEKVTEMNTVRILALEDKKGKKAKLTS